MNISFKIVPPSTECFSPMARSEDRSCFFSAQWNTYLEQMGRRSIIVELSRGEEKVGFFVGSQRHIGLRIVSAPSMGTGTYAQGLCLLQPFSEEERIELYVELAQWFFKTHRAHYVQICDFALHLDAETSRHPLLDAAGVHYQPRATYHLPLNRTEEQLWAAMSQKSCRYSISKARRLGLEVRFVEKEEEIDAFCSRHRLHIEDVLRRKHNRGLPCQSLKYISALCHSLFPDFCIMAEVYGTGADGKPCSMASGIFAGKDGLCTYFTAASFEQYMHLCPNELLVWESIRRLRQQGATDLIFGGVAHYKKKYSPTYAFVPVLVFSRFRLLLDLRRRLKLLYKNLIHLAGSPKNKVS